METTPATAPDSGRDTSQYSLSVEAASRLFAAAGVPRSTRSIQRYCKRSILDAIAIDTDANEKYLIDPESVERRITELKQIYQTSPAGPLNDTTSRDTSGHNATGRDESRRDTTSRDTEGNVSAPEKRELEAKIAELKNENEELKFDSRVNRELARYVQQQNRDLITTIGDQSRAIGRLETELRMIEAPARTAAPDLSHDDTIVRDVGTGDNSAH
jgi:hypothetical protein